MYIQLVFFIADLDFADLSATVSCKTKSRGIPKEQQYKFLVCVAIRFVTQSLYIYH